MSTDQTPEYLGVLVAAVAAAIGLASYITSNRQAQDQRKKESADREIQSRREEQDRWKEQHDKDKELLTDIITPLLKEYNNLDEAETAIDILDNYDYIFKNKRDKAYRR